MINPSKIRFIGDIHGRFDIYNKIIKESPYKTIQCGDMGIGFPSWFDTNHQRPNFDTNHLMIRGNHDNPNVCFAELNSFCIRDGTYDKFRKIMFIGGAWSIDSHLRTIDIDWWSNEELSTVQCNKILNWSLSDKPQIIVSHDGPDEITKNLVNGELYPSRTGQLLQRIYELVPPKLWIFGHYHRSYDEVINGCRFVCLDEFEYKDIDLETYL